MTDCRNAPFRELAEKEWIVTNGIGGYASSSLSGANTRRYHGLLVASFNPPTERLVVVSKIEETICQDGADYPLSCNRYTDVVHPEGYRNLAAFERNPLPVFTYETGKAVLAKTIWMVHGSNTTVVEYANTGASAFLLKLNPFFVYRDYHSLWHELPNFDFQARSKKEMLVIYPYYGADAVYMRFTRGVFIENRYWNNRLFYPVDRERGQSHIEDTYSIGGVEETLQPGECLHIIFSLDERLVQRNPAQMKQTELKRIGSLVPETTEINGWLRDLMISGDQFIVKRQSTENYSVIAGYHWFTDWGRDSMIAIRGLCIAAGRKDIARSVIRTFLSYLKQGIIPNRFPDYQGDLAEYNTVDATLWLFVALFDYDSQFNDREFLTETLPKLEEILHWHIRGTKHNIRVDDASGLLMQGARNIQLTWMDARIGDTVFTPREGCPVEVNALWYNALKVYEHACHRLKKKPDDTLVGVIEEVEKNFLPLFWNKKGYLNDVIMPDGAADESIRPNQVYAVSLPFSPLPEKEARMVVDCIQTHLLTPYGLRTLAPSHPDFRAHYAGDVWERDAAYHQGTVWPFLLPEYLSAYLRLNGNSDEAKRTVSGQLRELKDHFYSRECIGGISEIFDGLHPSRGKGCMQQAWSVSNLVLLLLRSGIIV